MDFKKLVFVSGKGGTGKSTVAATLAKTIADQGRRVLLVELEQQSSVKALLELSNNPQYLPSASGLGFDWCRLSGRDCLVEYVSSYTRLESFTQKFFDSALLKTLINVAPGLNDLSILGKLTSQIRGHGPGFDYDHIIIDAPSTGSFHSLIKAPMTLGDSVTRGPLHSQSLGIDQVLKNPDHTQFFFVSLYEELPVDELEDTLAEFTEEYDQQVSVVMNKSLGLAVAAPGQSRWSEFIFEKIAEQEQQKARVIDLWSRCYQLELFTSGFNRFLCEQRKEVLRPL